MVQEEDSLHYTNTVCEKQLTSEIRLHIEYSIPSGNVSVTYLFDT